MQSKNNNLENIIMKNIIKLNKKDAIPFYISLRKDIDDDRNNDNDCFIDYYIDIYNLDGNLLRTKYIYTFDSGKIKFLLEEESEYNIIDRYASYIERTIKEIM